MASSLRERSVYRYAGSVEDELRTENPARQLPVPENKKFYPALDGLRAVAVLMVFYHHYIGVTYYGVFRWGWAGVDIFFVLSGFLITGILYDTRDTTHRFRNFYVRRILRIFPLYYGVFLVALLLTPIFHWIWHPVWYLWPLYLGNYGRFIWISDFLKGSGTIDHLRSSLHYETPAFMYFGHFWSLCVEEQFYLVWPLVIFSIKDRLRLRNICTVLCILSLAARILCVCFAPDRYLRAELLYRFTPLRADALVLGGLVALMLRGPEAGWLHRMVRPALFLFVGSFIAFEAIFRIRQNYFYAPEITSAFLSTIGFTLIELFAAVVILSALEPKSVLYGLFTLKPLRWLGQMSYGFYVFHDIPHIAYIWFVARIFGPSRQSTYLVASVGFLCTLILSYLSFHFFETPFLRLKEPFTD